MTRKVCSIDDNGSGGGAGGGPTRSNSARKPNQNGRIKVESIPLRPIRVSFFLYNEKKLCVSRGCVNPPPPPHIMELVPKKS